MPSSPCAAGAPTSVSAITTRTTSSFAPELGLFVLADGAGGHNAGNVASALAATTVANVFETSATTLAKRPEIDEFGLWTMARRLATAVQRANAEVIEVAKKTEKYQGMGTTAGRSRPSRPTATSCTSRTSATAAATGSAAACSRR